MAVPGRTSRGRDSRHSVQVQVVAWMTLAINLAVGDKTTCTTSINGVSANITCHFPEDVGISKRSVSVYRFDLDSPSSPVNVFGCVWLANGNRRCDSLTGYTCDDTPTTTLTVTVNEFSSEFEGIYTCQVIPSRSEDIGKCKLVLKDATTIQPVNSTSLHTENMTHTPEDGNADVNVAWIVVPIVVVIVAVMVVSVVCIIRRARRHDPWDTCYSEVPQLSSVKNSHLTQPETSLQENAGRSDTFSDTGNHDKMDDRQSPNGSASTHRDLSFSAEQCV